MIHSSKQHSVQAFVQRVAAIKFKMTFSFIQTFHVFYGQLFGSWVSIIKLVY